MSDDSELLALVVSDRTLAVKPQSTLAQEIARQSVRLGRYDTGTLFGMCGGGSGVGVSVLALLTAPFSMPIAVIGAASLLLGGIGFAFMRKYNQTSNTLDELHKKRFQRLHEATVQKLREAAQLKPLTFDQSFSVEADEETPKSFVITSITTKMAGKTPTTLLTGDFYETVDKDGAPLAAKTVPVDWMKSAVFTNDHLKGALNRLLALPAPGDSYKARILASLMPDIMLAYQQNQLDIDHEMRCQPEGEKPLVVTISSVAKTKPKSDSDFISISLTLALYEAPNPLNLIREKKGPRLTAHPSLSYDFIMPARPNYTVLPTQHLTPGE